LPLLYCLLYFICNMNKVLVSRCLLGEICRWDAMRLDYDILDHLKRFEPVGICPEIEGGLPCPRPKAEIKTGDGKDVLDRNSQVIDISGTDLTEEFIKGAQATLNLAIKDNIKIAFLKEKSPSCGVNYIYNNGTIVNGMGVTTALLRRHGLEVIGFGS
jgi:uncharacterized protein YbbK (DUF523 family)